MIESRSRTKKLRGIFCVLITPFKGDESLDEERLRSHIDRVIEKGVHGITTSGSTGEFASLSREERKKVIEATIDQVNGRVPVEVGVMAPSTRETIEWAKFAEDLGADALLVVNPYYGKQTDEALYQHYKAVAKSVDIPIMPYNNTDASGNDIKPEVVARLCEDGYISYLKECVDSRRMQLVIEKCGDKIGVFTGVDDLLFQAFTLGAAGAVSGGSNAFPDKMVELWDLIQKGDIKAARDLWYRYVPIAILVETPAVWIQNIRVCCEIVGDPLGPPRRPLLPASDETKQILRGYIRNLGYDV